MNQERVLRGIRLPSFLILLIALLLMQSPNPSAASSPAGPPIPPEGGDVQDPQQPMAPQAMQCFSEAGTYGTYYGGLVVTTSGSCGSQLTWGGITGMWIGSSGDEACTFSFSYPVDATSASVLLTAHSCDGASYCEVVRFRLNGLDYNVQTGDIDNTTPTGGDPLIALPSGEVEPTGPDGRGTVTFNSGPTQLASIEIDHIHTIGDAAGTVYQICLEDTPTAVTLQGATARSGGVRLFVLSVSVVAVALGEMVLMRRRWRVQSAKETYNVSST